MGVELRLAPLMTRDYWVSHEMIDVGTSYDLWDAINILPQIDIPKPLICFFARDEQGEHVYGEIVETPYGNRMKFVTASDLLTLSDHEHVQDNWRNKAVWAYLAEMPHDWPIVLYWH